MKNVLTQSLAKYYLPGGNVLNTGHNLCKGQDSVKMSNSTRNAIKLISHFFSPINVLASKPRFTFNSNSIIINVFYYIPDSSLDLDGALNNNTINNLGEALSSLFKQRVELRLVKLQYPYLDSYILAQFISLNTQDYTMTAIVRRIFSSISPVKNTSSDIYTLNSKLPSHIVGIKVRVSGRLATERSRPRQTVQSVQIGSFAKDNLSLVDIGSFTSKNKKGAFTVKVWISQRAVV